MNEPRLMRLTRVDGTALILPADRIDHVGEIPGHPDQPARRRVTLIRGNFVDVAETIDEIHGLWCPRSSLSPHYYSPNGYTMPAPSSGWTGFEGRERESDP